MHGDGSVTPSRIPGRFRLEESKKTNPIAVGDLVDVRDNGDGSGTITEIKPRQNQITRKATHGRRGEHVLVTNVDYGIVVQSVKKPVYKTGFIDRFLIACSYFDVEPVICFNKIDLAKAKDLAQLQETEELYNSLGVTTFRTSTIDETGLLEVRDFIADKISAFTGPSGVGKTSLLNAIDPQWDKAVGAVSGFSNKGKHTTTFAELFPLEFGGYLVDTPGIREFGLVDILPEQIAAHFPEMAPVIDDCQFYNCSHTHEPGCQVKAGIADGRITETRYNSYLNIYNSLVDGT